MPYGISRQIYYYTGEFMVEIQGGGIDFAGPDMLVPAYGYAETREYDKPQSAALEAIKIAKLWQKDEPEEEIHLTVRSEAAGLFGMEGDPMTVGQVARWAREEWCLLPKCAECGEVMPDERNRWGHDFVDGYPFCSDNCSDNDYWRLREDDEELFDE